MTDVFSKNKRSWIMSRVKGKDTKPEILVRSFLFKMGFRFRLHRNDLPGTPDIILPRHRKIIFVHGCFWHGHKNCTRSKRPAANKNFWKEKLNSNIERDQKNYKDLKNLGWEVLVIWECETKNSEKLLEKLERFMYDGRKKISKN